MKYFTSDQKESFKRIELFRDMISEQILREEPCPLLDSQLNELRVFTSKLHASIVGLQEDLSKRKS